MNLCRTPIFYDLGYAFVQGELEDINFVGTRQRGIKSIDLYT